ncbi:hypothetical protein [Rhizobium sp. BK176]|uniref:hypothetical protein n=1 Tax=Rhizobium sp. BK176 TaxID=2587071 RepID=UPI00216A434F|nr:hypothetical protein [Rhizobium sp. BK176]MCS4088473.1 hypothetical protein [Rhizobium sp. BK176]
MALVRVDDVGLYVVVNGHKARPGNVAGYSHSHRMDDGGLSAGDKVKAAQRSQSAIVKVTLESGSVVFWHCDTFRVKRTFDFTPDDFDETGFAKSHRLDPSPVRAAPRQIGFARLPEAVTENKTYVDGDHETYLQVRQSDDESYAIVTSKYTRTYRNGETAERVFAQIWSEGTILHQRSDMDIRSLETMFPHVVASSEPPAMNEPTAPLLRPR